MLLFFMHFPLKLLITDFGNTKTDGASSLGMLQKTSQFAASRNGQVRDPQHVQRNPVDLSPDSTLPLLPVPSSSQLFHSCLFPSFLLFSNLASSPALFYFCLVSFLPIPKENQSNNVLPARSLAMGVLLFRRIRA